MEPAEVASLEAAIKWLVGTILAVLLMGKMDAWIRRVKLDDEVEKLRIEIRRVGMVVATVKGRATGNELLGESLVTLKELLYDADDVVDELDYYRLQQQVEGVTRDEPEGMRGAERVDEISRGGDDTTNSGVGKLWSPVWQHFTKTKKVEGVPAKAECTHCQLVMKTSTSSMKKHLWRAHRVTCELGEHPPNPSSTVNDATENATPIVIGSSSRGKRKRTNEDSAQITAANTHNHWDKAEISHRIKEITSQLKDIREEVCEVLKLHGPDFASCSNNHRRTASAQQLRTTSSLVPTEVYGRVAEKKAIIEMITEDKSNGVTVLPIVGIAGVGKTTLAQLVYNDPDVKSKFDTKIWVWVSCNFDEVRLTREMLDFAPQDRQEGSLHRNERHEGISSFAKLQEILKERMEYQPKRFLLILDDVWDNLDDERWNKLLNPLVSSQVKGNVILVTTRNLCIAQKKGTLEPIQLCALADEDFWLLFKSRAFGDENYKGDPSLSIIGRQIAEKLKGNPLAAETAGELLREHLTIDHWTNILKDEHWKSLQLSTGIMCALRLSYDQLPYHLQQCFSCTSIFPRSYRFPGEMLVRIWISQGFVKGNQSSKRLEEIGRHNLTVLVNLGFIQQVEFSLSRQPCYTICCLMHDFGRIVSRTECAIIDGLQCNEMLPTVRHLLIVTDYAYNKDQHGEFPRNELFEETLRNTVTSVSKLRTLVLLGNYDSFFLQLFQDIFQKAQNLRLLQMCATSVDCDSFLYNSVNLTHLRYLKRWSVEVRGDFPQVFSKLYHLQVLDVNSYAHPTAPNGMRNLVSLRHLVPEKGVYDSIASIGSMTSLQELHDFKVQTSSGFEITQLQSMNELVTLGVSQLDNVKSSEEAYGAGLRNKGHLEKLHLSWKDTLSDNESPADTARRHSEVLEGLKPHKHLKHLQISGYNGTSPTWLASNMSVTSLQTLHLDCCGEWEILPSLERFPCLRKLKLSNLWKVTEILVPSLEKLVLVDMPELERCSCTSVEGFNSSLRALLIKNCEKLKVFDLFENGDKFKVEQRSWLSDVRELVLLDCPLLEVFNLLPPSAAFSKLQIGGVSRLPSMGGSYEKLHIVPPCVESSFEEDPSSEWISVGEVLAFHNLRSLKFLSINGLGENPMSISFKDLSHLVSLKSLEISGCEIVFSSYVMPESTREDVPAASCKVFPSLQGLSVKSCGITGTGLSLMLQHSPDLEQLVLSECSDLESLQLHSCTALEELQITYCNSLSIVEGLQSLGSLRDLTVHECPRLPSYLESFSRQCHELLPRLETLVIDDPDVLTTSFCKHLTSLHSLQLWLWGMEVTRLPEEQERAFVLLKSLQELTFTGRQYLIHLPARLHTLPSLKRLKIDGCSSILSLRETGLPVSLEELELEHCSEELNDQCKLLATSKLKVKIIPRREY